MRVDSVEAWLEYKARKRQFKSVLRRRKRESWRHFCSAMKEVPEVCRLQKIISKDPQATLGLVKTDSGELTENLEETAKEMLKTHFP